MKSSPEIMEMNTVLLSYKEGDSQSCLFIYAYSDSHMEKIPQEVNIIGEGGDNVFLAVNLVETRLFPMTYTHGQ